MMSTHQNLYPFQHLKAQLFNCTLHQLADAVCNNRAHQLSHLIL